MNSRLLQTVKPILRAFGMFHLFKMYFQKKVTEVWFLQSIIACLPPVSSGISIRVINYIKLFLAWSQSIRKYIIWYVKLMNWSIICLERYKISISYMLYSSCILMIKLYKNKFQNPIKNKNLQCIECVYSSIVFMTKTIIIKAVMKC